MSANHHRCCKLLLALLQVLHIVYPCVVELVAVVHGLCHRRAHLQQHVAVDFILVHALSSLYGLPIKENLGEIKLNTYIYQAFSREKVQNLLELIRP